jgi:O-antigen ligase
MFFGYGPGSFMEVFRNYNSLLTPTYAHNCYLQMLLEIGSLGLLAFFSIISVFFGTVFKVIIKNNDFLLLGITSGILAYLIHAGFDTHFYSMQLSDFFWIMLGLAIAIKRIGPIEI